MKFSYSQFSHDELDTPKVLYKYRSWGCRFHKTLLTKREVYMASPSTFEDLKDARITRARFSFTQDDILNEYFNISKKERPDKSIEDHMVLAAQLSADTDLEQLSDDLIEHYSTLDANIGVLSLGMTYDNSHLWNAYAGEGTGFCVGIDTQYLFAIATRGANVTYCDILPSISLQESLDVQIYNHVFCKESTWEQEDEYRVYKYSKNGLNEANRIVRLPKEAFVEVIFGACMSNVDRLKIMNVCKSTGLNPRFLQAAFRDKQLIYYFIEA